MSRSKHTDPRSIRAARRFRAPFETRSAGDLSLRRKLGQKLKELSVTVLSSGKGGKPPRSVPRILRREPSPGFHHPIEKRHILELLKSIGPLVTYGLRSIELTHVPALGRAHSAVFGRYEAPGRILLFEQPPPPWRLPGLLAKENAKRFEGTVAVVSRMPHLGATLVDWPADTFRRFMLEEVLLHELGHHVLQHHKAKRLARIARTKDHEAFAALFAARQQMTLAKRNSSAR